MKKIFVIFAVIAVALSCSKKQDPVVIDTPDENTPSGELVAMTFHAVGEDTKTTLDGTSISWSTSDHINVFSGASFGTNTKFDVASVSSSGHEATFDGLGTVSPEYYALFPYQSGATITSAGAITATLPVNQAAVPGTFGPEANLAVAYVSGSDELVFKNVGALLGVTINEDGVNKVKVESLDGTALSGTATINYNGGDPTITVTDGKSFVESAVSGTGTYYFVVFPGAHSGGFRITLTRPGYTASVKNTKSITIGRNDNINLMSIASVPADKWNVVFTPGEKVYIKGLSNADENGQEVSYIPTGYYSPRSGGVAPTSPTPGDVATLAGITYNYEVWAKIGHDDVVYFESENGARFAISNYEGTAVAPIAPTSAGRDGVSVSDDVYRIRLNLPSGDAQILRVSIVNFAIMYGDVSQNLTYDKAGAWKVDNYVFSYATNQSWDPTNHRYMFSIWFTWKGGWSGSSFDQWQWYGTCNKYTDIYPTSLDPSENYYYLQPFTGSDWDMIFYMPKDYLFPGMANQSKKGTLGVYMNNTYGHFTHGFSNVVDNS